jgi:hypothetical protein
MNYKEKSNKWYKRALKEKDPFVKFLLLYIALEVRVKSEFSTIRDIKNNNSIKENFYKIDLTHLEELKTVLDETPLKNMKNINDKLWSGQLNSIDDFEGIIEFVIRGRNNLFHGDKGLNEKRDEFIIKEGNLILEPLLTVII